MHEPTDNPPAPRDAVEALARIVRELLGEAAAGDVRPEALTRKESARLIGVGLSHFAEMERSGSLGPLPIHVGGERAVRYLRGELVDWLRAGAPHRQKWAAIRQARRAS